MSHPPNVFWFLLFSALDVLRVILCYLVLEILKETMGLQSKMDSSKSVEKLDMFKNEMFKC